MENLENGNRNNMLQARINHETWKLDFIWLIAYETTRKNVGKPWKFIFERPWEPDNLLHELMVRNGTLFDERYASVHV